MRFVRPLSGLVLLVGVGVGACGGSSFESAPAGAAGAAGAGTGTSGQGGAGSAGKSNGGAGGVGAGAAGTTSAGAAGNPSAGSAGVSSGGAGGATSGGSGGTISSGGATSGGSGGTISSGGSGGTISSGGATSGGSGGAAPCTPGATECVGTNATRTCNAGVWSPPSTCPSVPDPCTVISCQAGACKMSNGTPPADPPHNCQSAKCDNGTTTLIMDSSDVPAALGPCDAPSCGTSGPAHAASDAKCSAIRACDGQTYQCVCRPCPVGSVAGLPGGECAIGNDTTQSSATSTLTGSDPAQAIDKSASARWLAGSMDATITLDVPALPMSAIVIWPSVLSSVVSPVTVVWTVDVTDGKGNVTSYPATVKYAAGDPPPLKIQLAQPIVVEKISIRGQAGTLSWGIYEVTYLLCS